MKINEAIARIVERHDLNASDMEQVMEEIMTGAATPAQVGSFITALRMKGETVAEITGAARVMRAKATRVETGFDLSSGGEILVDTCGTGGDGCQTFNISTTTALVVAAAGLKVAKHGNRSVSSRCGSADVLQALGVNLELTPAQVAVSIQEIGIGFLFAPLLHRAMKYAIGPRREIAIRTIFNLLGPLTNPAAANVQLLGVYDPALTRPLAEVLKGLGGLQAMVVHGAGGLDELSLAGANQVVWLRDGELAEMILRPADVGLTEAPLAAVRGGDVEENALLLKKVLAGIETGPPRDIVLLNSAAVFVVAGQAAGFRQGVELAQATIASGRALAKLEKLVAFSQALKPVSGERQG
ncbi:MAG TPA: anthranilate phosphoribosyltransferase [Proteobacteria bacterium]|nr:anthranilate phosphoribosyltransferase [Pseudomonadota bacterium]